MYFRFQKKTQLLDIKDSYAHLADVLDNGDLKFEFTYSITHRDVITHKAQRVTIDVESRHIVKKPLLGKTQRGRVDTRALVSNVRTAIIDAKSTLQQRSRYLIAQRHSDITAFVNNDVLPQLRARAPVTAIPFFNRPRLALVPVNDVKENNDPQPLLHRIANTAVIPDFQLMLTASAGEDPQALMHDMITRQGLDPSYILNLAPRALSEATTHGGLSNPTHALEYVTDPATRLLHHHLFPPIFDVPPTTTEHIVDTDMVHVLQTVTDDTIDVTVPVVIPAAKLKEEGANITQLYVIFHLIDSTTNLPLDSITKVLDVSKHLHVFHTPKLAPRVKAASSEVSTRINLEIKQVDPGATEVQVFKKAFWVASTEVDDYSLVGTYNLTSQDQSLLIQVDLPRQSPALYRVIARGRQSMQGFDYTNVAIRPHRYSPVRAVSLTAKQVDTGIQLEVRHLPTNAVAVTFLRWNLTTFDDAPSIEGTDVGFIDDAVRRADLLTTIDTDMTLNNIYRYVARVIYKDGSTNDFGNALLEFIQPSPGQVDTRIDDLNVSHDVVPNVTFGIATITVDTDLDAVKKMVENQGLTPFFQGDIQEQRDQLTHLIAHSVQRIDLNTGERENFGVLTGNTFDDGALRKNQAIKPLVYGHRYRYEIYPLLRAPETMFDSFQKEATDAVTKKPYTFFPAKFLHPHTLRRGVIVTANGAKQRHAKDPMAYGVIGSITSVEVSFDEDSARVIDPVAANFDRKLNVISWKLLGDIHQVDHFLILKEVHGMRSFIGKAHSEFTNGICQYLHPITNHDVGSLRYVIIPVYGDYKLGAHATTNTLLVEAP
jgi:hypothetical protein